MKYFHILIQTFVLSSCTGNMMSEKDFPTSFKNGKLVEKSLPCDSSTATLSPSTWTMYQLPAASFEKDVATINFTWIEAPILILDALDQEGREVSLYLNRAPNNRVHLYQNLAGEWSLLEGSRFRTIGDVLAFRSYSETEVTFSTEISCAL